VFLKDYTCSEVELLITSNLEKKKKKKKKKKRKKKNVTQACHKVQ